MNGNGRASNYIEGPTSSIRERICAARKQASDVGRILQQLLVSCATLEAQCVNTSEPTNRDELQQAHREILGALSHVVQVQDRLDKVQQ